MKRPIVFRLFPFHALQKQIFFRRYFPVQKRWHALFDSCRLTVAPQIRLKLLPTDFMHGVIAFTGVYEMELTKRISKSAAEGGLLVDVGANIGYFSLIWASLNASNRVLAFEASPRNAGMLQANIDSNNMRERVKMYPVALGKEKNVLPFDLGPVELTGWGGLSLASTPATIEVPVERLDDIIDPFAIIDVMKVDVEGADTWVIMGAEKLLLERRIKIIYFEQNKTRLKQLNIAENAAVEYLSSVGYHAEAMSDVTQDIVDWKAMPKEGR
jgi:FkbM family methyltransferase